jgi:hypothetical protein
MPQQALGHLASRGISRAQNQDSLVLHMPLLFQCSRIHACTLI